MYYCVKESECIKPFNDFFYYTCFYNSIAPVLDAYNVPISLIFGNVQYYYKFNDGIITVKYELYKILKNILDESGVWLHEYKGNVQIKEILKSELESNHPVIIFVDLFYLPYRADEYMKIHEDHSLLVIGYDDEKESLRVLEQTSINELNFNIMDINVDDMVLAHKEYVERINDFDFQFCSLEKKIDPVNHKNSLEYYWEVDHYLKKKKINGLDGLRLFLCTMEGKMDHVEELEKQIVELESNIRYILKAVKGERKLLEMMQDEQNLSYMELIEEAWTNINNIIQYFYFSKRYKKQKLEVIITNLKRILKIEEKRLKRYDD